MTQRMKVRLSIEPPRDYEVEFGEGGRVRVWSLFSKAPVNRRGFYQADTGSREIDAKGPTALRAISAASCELDALAALRA